MFTTTEFWEQGVPPPPPPAEAVKETVVIPHNVAVPHVVQFVV